MQNVAKDFVAVARKWGITNGKILDVGTGTGLIAIEFAKNLPELEVIGLDLSEDALQEAERNVQECEVPLKISFEKGNAEDMPFDDSVFDLLISNNALHLVEDPVKMFNEIQRVLKPGGRFFISDFRRSWISVFSKHWRPFYSSDEIRNLLLQSELEGWKVKNHFLRVGIFSEES